MKQSFTRSHLAPNGTLEKFSHFLKEIFILFTILTSVLRQILDICQIPVILERVRGNDNFNVTICQYYGSDIYESNSMVI